MATKKEIYAKKGVDYDTKTGKILVPVYGWIKPVLKNGNDKLGKGCWNFSTLPTDQPVVVNMGTKNSPDVQTFQGTCSCTCYDEEGNLACYACNGRCAMDCCRKCWARHTTLARKYMDFLERAITAQIIADKIVICRIHVSGDFFSDEYAAMWRRIALNSPSTCFWTYTKVMKVETAFEDVPNLNVVKSLIPGHGFNFGTCGYLISLYEALREKGEDVYICRCGIDPNQHCTKCNSCYSKTYVLFLEHGTKYEPEKDPLFPAFVALVESQEKPVPILAA